MMDRHYEIVNDTVMRTERARRPGPLAQAIYSLAPGQSVVLESFKERGYALKLARDAFGPRSCRTGLLPSGQYGITRKGE